MHRDEVRVLRGSAERHVEFLVQLRGSAARREALEDATPRVTPALPATPLLEPLEYHPYREDRVRSAAFVAARRIGWLWDAFCCLLPAFLMWLLCCPAIDQGLVYCIGIGVVFVLVAGYAASHAIELPATRGASS